MLLLVTVAFASELLGSLAAILEPLPPSQELAEEASSSPANPVAAEQPSKEPLELPIEAAAVHQPIKEEALLSAVVAELQSRLRPAGDLILQPLRALPDLRKHSQPFWVNLVNAPNTLARGNIMLRFQVENEEGVLGDWSVPFRPGLLSEVWYAKSYLKRGEPATPSDLDVRETDLLIEPDAVPAALELVLRREYVRDVRPGALLVWSDLVERSLVSKGEVVEVIASKGLMAITMRAVARQDGSDGDIILLRNFDSSKEFSGRVVSENRVEVSF